MCLLAPLSLSDVIQHVSHILEIVPRTLYQPTFGLISRGCRRDMEMRSTPPADPTLSNLSRVICGLGEDIQPRGPCSQSYVVSRGSAACWLRGPQLVFPLIRAQLCQVRSQVSHGDVLDEIRQRAGQGDVIEVHGDQWKGFRVACLLPADHRVNDITGCFAVSRWGNADGRHCGVTQLLG